MCPTTRGPLVLILSRIFANGGFPHFSLQIPASYLTWKNFSCPPETKTNGLGTWWAGFYPQRCWRSTVQGRQRWDFGSVGSQGPPCVPEWPGQLVANADFCTLPPEILVLCLEFGPGTCEVAVLNSVLPPASCVTLSRFLGAFQYLSFLIYKNEDANSMLPSGRWLWELNEFSHLEQCLRAHAKSSVNFGYHKHPGSNPDKDTSKTIGLTQLLGNRQSPK